TGQEYATFYEQAAVRSVAFSPDGRCLATGNENWVVKVWDLMPKKPLSLEGKAPVNNVAFSPDGRLLAGQYGDRTVRVWDPGSGKQVLEVAVQPPVSNGLSYHRLAFSPNGRWLAAGASPDIKVWDVATRREKAALPGGGGVLEVAFSRCGRFLASAGS